MPRHLLTAASLSTSPLVHAIADLCIIAFYYLLRVGEYTQHPPRALRRTTPFCLQDITLWQASSRLEPANLPLHVLLRTTTAASLRLRNQKTGVRNSVIHHAATHLEDCPVAAILRRIVHLRSHHASPSTHIATYYSAGTSSTNIVTSGQISSALKLAVVAGDLPNHGFVPAAVSSHSLRSGGAMALYLQGVPASTIQKMGRWSSDVFLTYIQAQIAGLTGPLAQIMSQSLPFHNLLGPHLSTDQK